MILALALWGCATTCKVAAPLNYDAREQWLCRPGTDGVCPASQTIVTVPESGPVAKDVHTYASDTDLACFVVYPTVDLRLGTGLHVNLDDLDNPEEWVEHQAAPLADACDLYVPVYRQVAIGTYVGGESDKKSTCFANAYDDVRAAFARFQIEEPDRRFALVGHSQGAQHLSRLLAEEIEGDDALYGRMVAAYLVGWSLGTDEDGRTGGSFRRTPVCTDASGTGCVIGYRTFLAGEDLPERGRFEEGEQSVCVNPADAGSDEPAVLAAYVSRASDGRISLPDGVEGDDGVLVRYPDAYEASCVRDGVNHALEVQWARSDEEPVKHRMLKGALGAHPIDMNLTIADIVEDLRVRAGPTGAR